MIPVLVALGSNLGDSEKNIRDAVARLEEAPGISQLRTSHFFSTSPIGGPPNQATFCNAATTFFTKLSPGNVLETLQRIENALGRTRKVRWAARTIDLDLLLYGDACVESATLQVPHPRMLYRKFVLRPAIDIAADWKHPVTGWTLQQHWDHLESSDRYVAIVGSNQSVVSAVAQQVAAATASSVVLRAQCENNNTDCVEQPRRVYSTLSTQFLVSDFWMAESADQFNNEPTTAPQPRLLVVIGNSESEAQDDLERRIRDSDVGPVLRLNDIESAADEVQAAIEAMR